MARFDARWIDDMMSPERERLTRPRALLAAAEVKRGSTVIDYGAGPGLFALAAADLVGATGRVIGIDSEPKMRDELLRRAAIAHRGTIEATTPDEAMTLEDGTADCVVAALFLHDLTPLERDAVLPELRRLCAADGRLLVVEWVAPGGLAGRSTRNRFAALDLTHLLRRHGFVPGVPQRLGDTYFAIVARRAAD